MKVIIAGSRTFHDYQFLKEEMEKLNLEIDEVVCGEAFGADTLGRKWAIENNIPIKSFYPDWNRLGKAAGMIRNHQMGDYADYLVAFWDGKSRGTKDMIDYMQQLGKHGSVIIYERKEI